MNGKSWMARPAAFFAGDPSPMAAHGAVAVIGLGRFGGSLARNSLPTVLTSSASTSTRASLRSTQTNWPSSLAPIPLTRLFYANSVSMKSIVSSLPSALIYRPVFSQLQNSSNSATSTYGPKQSANPMQKSSTNSGLQTSFAPKTIWVHAWPTSSGDTSPISCPSTPTSCWPEPLHQSASLMCPSHQWGSAAATASRSLRSKGKPANTGTSAIPTSLSMPMMRFS